MPYIVKDRRPEIVNEWHSSGGAETLDPPEEAGMIINVSEISSPGELNYAMTKMLHFYIEQIKGPSYSSYNEAVGVLQCAMLELYRRKIAPYEDEKIEENGDV